MTVVRGRLCQAEQGAATADLNVVRMRAEAQDVELVVVRDKTDHPTVPPLSGSAQTWVRRQTGRRTAVSRLE